jgi:hypothetical protein
MEGKLTVIYESPYWVGIFERTNGDTYQATRFIFGAEPTDPQLLQFALTVFPGLQFSRPAEISAVQSREVNFKRRMRQVKKQMTNTAGPTRAQMAIKQEYEDQARQRAQTSHEVQVEEADRKFQLKQAKRAKKHRGH